MKVQTLDPATVAQVQPLDLERMRVAFCAATDEAVLTLGWKKEAIAAALNVDPSYFTKLRNGEKPLSLRHVADLPDDIEAIYARKYAESFGHIVVQPVTGDAAIRNLVSGLFGVLGQRGAA